LSFGYAMEAIHIAGLHTAGIDALLADVPMPGISGMEGAKQIADLNTGMLIFFASARISRKERIATEPYWMPLYSKAVWAGIT
jgi:hypothetical protein